VQGLPVLILIPKKGGRASSKRRKGGREGGRDEIMLVEQGKNEGGKRTRKRREGGREGRYLLLVDVIVRHELESVVLTRDVGLFLELVHDVEGISSFSGEGGSCLVGWGRKEGGREGRGE